MATNPSHITTREMFELIDMHWSDLMQGDDTDWDKVWDLPLYLIEGDSGWTKRELEWAWDRYHNGPAHVR